MNNKKFAFTFVEILLTIVIIGVVMVIFTGTFKYNMSKKNIYKIRATLNNIQKVQEALLSGERAEGRWSLNESISTVCAQFADTINTKGDEDCSHGSFVMANNVAISNFNNNAHHDEWESPSGDIKHPYIEISFDINNKGDLSDIFQVRIFKDEPIVVPLGSLLNSADRVRFRVAQIKEKQNNTYIDTYRILKSGVSYREAACTAGVAGEFMTPEERGEERGLSCVKNAACNRYFDCRIQIMDIPLSANSFRAK